MIWGRFDSFFVESSHDMMWNPGFNKLSTQPAATLGAGWHYSTKPLTSHLNNLDGKEGDYGKE